jgi:hypothetical protein
MRRLSALCAVVLLGACDSNWEDWRERVGSKSALILDYNLQNYIPIPVKDKRPVRSLTRSDLIIENVTWTKRDESGAFLPLTQDTFLDGDVCRAVFTLTAQASYTFNPDIPFAYDPGIIEEQGAPDLDIIQRDVSIIYKPAWPDMTVRDYDLQDYVPVPVIQFPVTHDYKQGDMKVEVKWFVGSRPAPDAGYIFAPAPGNFSWFEGKVYKAEITLTAQNGYTFNEGTAFAYRPGTIESYVQEDVLTGKSPEELKTRRTIIVIYKPAPSAPPLPL